MCRGPGTVGATVLYCSRPIFESHFLSFPLPTLVYHPSSLHSLDPREPDMRFALVALLAAAGTVRVSERSCSQLGIRV